MTAARALTAAEAALLEAHGYVVLSPFRVRDPLAGYAVNASVALGHVTQPDWTALLAEVEAGLEGDAARAEMARAGADGEDDDGV